LNVYTPKSSLEGESEPLPVLVYIHGGSLVAGNGRLPLWNVVGDGGGKMIGVSIQYRLNIFGYLATKDLTEEQNGTSGNYGFLDQLLALQWVQDNIKSFGGDPSRVTIMGQSSGGTSVLALLTSPLSKGLFHHGISLSGSANITMSLSTIQQQNHGIITTLQCDHPPTTSDRLSCMRRKTVHQLVDAIPDSWFTPTIWSLPSNITGKHFAGLPAIDGVVLTKPLLQSLHDGLIDVPLIIGNVAEEMDVISGEVIGNMTIEEWQETLEESFEVSG